MTNQEHYEKAKASNWTYQPKMKELTITEMKVGSTYFDLDKINEDAVLLELKTINTLTNCVDFEYVKGPHPYIIMKNGLIGFEYTGCGTFYTLEP